MGLKIKLFKIMNSFLKFSLLPIIVMITINSFAQEAGFNEETIDMETNKNILIGYCTVDGVKNYHNMAEMFEMIAPVVEDYNAIVDSAILFKDVEILIVFGSWCSDSETGVPEVILLLEKIGFPQEKISLIAVDRDKKAPNVNLERMGVEFVPTVIVKKDGKELGRIIESPEDSYEIDLIKIVSKKEN